MKIAGHEIPMMGLGIAAAGAIGLVFFLRQSGGGGGETSGGGGFPYFQTAALPSSNMGGSTTVVSGAAPAADPNLSATLDASFGSLFAGLASQQSEQLAGAAEATGAWAPRHTPIATKGYYKPIVGGGYEFSLTNVTGGHLEWLNTDKGISAETIYKDYFAGNSTGGGSQVPAVT
jgi:hypothetical protein